MELVTKNAEETKAFGAKIGSGLKGGEVIALSGELGSGKTTFVQGLASSLGIEKSVISPTFILMRSYEIVQNLNFRNLYHIDLYRLEENIGKELENLGVKDYWQKKENIFIIEWAEKAKDIISEGTIWIDFSYIDESSRKILVRDNKLLF